MEKYTINNIIATCGYPSLDRVVKVCGDISVGKTTLIANSDNADIYYGGCGINIAYILSKLGGKGKVFFVAGTDFESSGYKPFLESVGVDTSSVAINTNHQTSNSYLIENEKGEHITLFSQGGMNGDISAIDEKALDGVCLAVLTVGEKKYNETFKQLAIKKNIPLIFSMKFDVDAFPKAELCDNIENSAYIFMNDSEYENVKSFLGYDESDFFANKCKCLLITKGAEGCIVKFKKDDIIHSVAVAANKVEKIVDSLGVGDAFVAGFLLGLTKNLDYVECAKIGSTVASFVLEGKGCLTNVPSMEQVKKRLNINYK